jgi:hypothetical protein
MDDVGVLAGVRMNKIEQSFATEVMWKMDVWVMVMMLMLLVVRVVAPRLLVEALGRGCACCWCLLDDLNGLQISLTRRRGHLGGFQVRS